MKDPNHNLRYLPRLYMVKGAYQSMRAAQEFMNERKVAEIDGWVVMGTSKRGWTTWMIGSSTCKNCPKIKGIIPMVPIEPTFFEGVHQMWRSFGAFSWAFKDYTDKDIIMPGFDTDSWKIAEDILDPLSYTEEMTKMPKLVIVASGDEFMQFEWTNLWWDKLPGEKHLLILPNTKHSMFSNTPMLANAIAWFFIRIRDGDTTSHDFTSSFDEKNGKISVEIAEDSLRPLEVSIRYAETLSTERRDVRWVSAAEEDGTCKFPRYKIKAPIDLCFQPIFWLKEGAEQISERSFEMSVPEPFDKDHWQGVFAQVTFPAYTPSGHPILDKFIDPNHVVLTSPGWVTPNTFPFEDCHLESCTNDMV